MVKTKRSKGINQRIRELSIYRKRRKASAKKRRRNILSNQRKNIEKPQKRSKAYFKVTNIKLSVTGRFSLLEDPLNVIKLVGALDNCAKRKKSFRTHIQVDLSEIRSIDIGAICVLLAKCHQLSFYKSLIIWGLQPNNPECNKIFCDSGFLDYMRDMTGNRFTKNSENLIVKIGTDKTDNERVGIQIKKAISFITGNETHFPPAFSILQEMCANSVEHANESRKNWLFGINYEEATETTARSVVFTMTDMGYGILKTIKRKFATILAESLSTDSSIMYRAFEKKYGSKTEDINRNKGLPLILSRVKKSFVKDVVVISNNVLLRLGDHGKSQVIGNNLPGTFYHFRIDLTCIEVWQKMSKR